jgi:hypothetical protein
LLWGKVNASSSLSRGFYRGPALAAEVFFSAWLLFKPQRLGNSIVEIGKPDNIIFSQIRTGLHFNDLQRLGSRIAEAMLSA